MSAEMDCPFHFFYLKATVNMTLIFLKWTEWGEQKESSSIPYNSRIAWKRDWSHVPAYGIRQNKRGQKRRSLCREERQVEIMWMNNMGMCDFSYNSLPRLFSRIAMYLLRCRTWCKILCAPVFSFLSSTTSAGIETDNRGRKEKGGDPP